MKEIVVSVTSPAVKLILGSTTSSLQEVRANATKDSINKRIFFIVIVIR